MEADDWGVVGGATCKCQPIQMLGRVSKETNYQPHTVSQGEVGATVGVLDAIFTRAVDTGDDPQLSRNPDVVELALLPALDLGS